MTVSRAIVRRTTVEIGDIGGIPIVGRDLIASQSVAHPDRSIQWHSQALRSGGVSSLIVKICYAAEIATVIVDPEPL